MMLNLFKMFNLMELVSLTLALLFSTSQVSASLSKPQLNEHTHTIPSHQVTTTPSCAFPLLKDRLLRMVSLNEPEAFSIILHSECRGQVDVLNHQYIQVFMHLLRVSSSRKVAYFLRSILRDECFSPLMLPAWTRNRHHLPLYVLEIFKAFFKHPDGSFIYNLSLEYPADSPERDFLANWLVKLQRATLKWPFQSYPIRPVGTRSLSPTKGRAKVSRQFGRSFSPALLKTKSLKSNALSWSQFPEFKLDDEDIKTTKIKSLKTESADALIPQTQPRPVNLNFGHIYGWVSRRGNPVVRNSNQPFNLYGHSVSVHDTFLGFASTKLNLDDFAEAAHNLKSFFIKSNSALAQRIKTIPANKNFAICRLTSAESSELQAILKGDLKLVVLGAQDGRYEFKFPANPYEELKQRSNQLLSLSLPIEPTDIVLFFPRFLFIDPENSISPHDIAGAFHYTDLSNFAGSFVRFINFVHAKTNHRGVIAVGGFVHETKNVIKNKKTK